MRSFIKECVVPLLVAAALTWPISIVPAVKNYREYGSIFLCHH